MPNNDILSIGNAQLIFRNFKGEGSKFNREGARNFCVIIDDSKLAAKLREEGWNVKKLKSKDEEDDDLDYIKVNVNFDGARPPKITVLSGKNRTVYDSGMVAGLDYADISNADLTISPYHYTLANGDTGISGYLKTAWITIQEDPFEAKYAAEEFPGENPGLEEDLPF